MSMRFPAICALALVGACNGPKESGDATRFGPPSAEAEIRSAFAVKSELPAIEDLRKFARSRGIAYERLQDRSLRYCYKGQDKASLSMTIFFFSSKGSRPGEKNYVAAHSKDGKVVCIETRHAYTSL
jgi:hypothetical protein